MTSALYTIAKGNASLVSESRQAVARTGPEWEALWAVHAGPDVRVPSVDFESRMVAAVFAGERPSPGYEVTIAGARRDGAALVLLVEEREPPPTMLAAQIITSPFHIVSLPRYDGDVRFAPNDEQSSAASPTPASHRRHEPSPSSTGLTPPVAAVLAYLAGPFSGALLLATERTSRFVRFHAWQSLIALGALGVAAVVFLLLAFALLLVSPVAFSTMLWLAALTALAWLLVWAVCLFEAYKGRVWKLPVVGVYAERRAFPKP